MTLWAMAEWIQNQHSLLVKRAVDSNPNATANQLRSPPLTVKYSFWSKLNEVIYTDGIVKHLEVFIKLSHIITAIQEVAPLAFKKKS